MKKIKLKRPIKLFQELLQEDQYSHKVIKDKKKDKKINRSWNQNWRRNLEEENYDS